jgi:hypothetical protein
MSLKTRHQVKDDPRMDEHGTAGPRQGAGKDAGATNRGADYG